MAYLGGIHFWFPKITGRLYPEGWAKFAALVVFVGVEALRVWWFRGYSRGTRTGIIRKISYKGPPYCKYMAGEMALQGTLPGQPVEIWEFSVDNESPSNQWPLCII